MVKIIKLDETYFIEIDALNWILKKRVPIGVRKGCDPSENTGKLRDVAVGYYGTLPQALGHYVDNLEKDGVTEDKNIADLIIILTDIDKAVKKLRLVETEVSK